MLRTTAIHLLCYENNFSEIDFWRKKVEKTIPFLYFMKMMKKYFSILGYFPVQAWITWEKNPLKRCPMWRKCIKCDCSSRNRNWLQNQNCQKMALKSVNKLILGQFFEWVQFWKNASQLFLDLFRSKLKKYVKIKSKISINLIAEYFFCVIQL
jgi:hypothetical protein